MSTFVLRMLHNRDVSPGMLGLLEFRLPFSPLLLANSFTHTHICRKEISDTQLLLSN